MIESMHLDIKIFADGADKKGMLEMYRNPLVAGFTTNPSLMRKAGINDYRAFATEMAALMPDRSISFEVFSDDFAQMKQQALEIASWGENIFAKIPVTNTQKQSAIPLIGELAAAGVKQNVTAIMTLEQVAAVTDALSQGPEAYVSVFAGRIADTGRNPAPMMQAALNMLKPFPQLSLLWASTREIYNIFEANALGCHIITVPNDLLSKLNLVGKNLEDYSLETVKMFYQDAQTAGYSLEISEPVTV